MQLSTSGLILNAHDPIDLQMHTFHSDGSWSPEDLLDHLVQENFKLGAITDHDCVHTIAMLQALAIEKQMPLLVATELTTRWGDNKNILDILCFGFDPTNPALNDLIHGVKTRQTENSREVYANLCKSGHIKEASDDELETIISAPSAQQQQELINIAVKHYEGDDPPSLGEIFKNTGIHFETTPTEIAVETIHRAEGVCLIAHPGRNDGFVTFDADVLDTFRQEIPIDGIEVHYPKHSAEQIAMFQAYADKHDLLTSTGSDSHGADMPPIKYEAQHSRKLLERLGVNFEA